MTTAEPRVVVIGAGISGIVAGKFLTCSFCTTDFDFTEQQVS
jgi:cation diffusion facilitator CzcD-associated flavoprotein CzcO